MSQNRYSRTHSYSTSDAYGYSGEYGNLCDDDDIELDDDEFLSDGYDDDLMQGSSNRNDSSQTVRRQHHNRLEQKRRAFIRDSYTDLKDVMPEYKGKKLSRANILINTRRKVEENRNHLVELKRLFENKKCENDREEREVINLERQLNNFESNGAYHLVDMQHSTPPLANIGINLVAGIQRPIASRRQIEPSYSDEGSSENNNTQPSHPVNSTGTSSNADTPSISSLTDSPINSAISSISSSTNNQPPILSVSNQQSLTEDSNLNGPAPQLDEPAAVRPTMLPIRRMRSFSTSQHAADSPDEKKRSSPPEPQQTTKRICVTTILPTPKN